jgi:hypothetical protein
MSEVRITRAEAEGSLPMVCMVCGARAARMVSKRFQWDAVRGGTGIAVGPMASPLGQVLSFATSRFMTVQAPLCRRHEGHWAAKWWTLGIGCGTVMLLQMVLIVTLVTLLVMRLDRGVPWVLFPGMVVTFGVFIGMVVRLSVLLLRSVHAVAITNEGITLTNVSGRFAEAVRAERREAKPPGRRPPRDDFDFGDG